MNYSVKYHDIKLDISKPVTLVDKTIVRKCDGKKKKILSFKITKKNIKWSQGNVTRNVKNLYKKNFKILP